MYVTLPRCDTKKSAYISSFYTVFIKICAITWALVAVFKTDFYESCWRSVDGRPFKTIKEFYYYGLIHCSFYLLTGIVLYFGVKKNNRYLLLPHLAGTIIDIILKLVAIMVFIQEGLLESVLRMFFVFSIVTSLGVILLIKVAALSCIAALLIRTKEIEDFVTLIGNGVPFTITRNFYWFATIHCSIYFVFAALLLYAIKTNSRKLMIPWMIGTIQDAAIKLTFISVYMKDGGHGNLGLMFVIVNGMFWFICMLVYEFFCVASHYNSLDTQQYQKPKHK